MSSPVPETRQSLILRLPDRGDIDAWDQFVQIYEPLVYRLAKSRGMQHADAQEIVQEVMLSVSRAVDRWDPDKSKGRFRDWLFRIARNLMINFLTRRKHRPLGSGDTDVALLLNNQVADNGPQSLFFDQEYRREVFHWASQQVKPAVTQRTWRAFWKTSVVGEAAADVAADLGMTRGAVHIARSRVLGRLRKIVQTVEN